LHYGKKWIWLSNLLVVRKARAAKEKKFKFNKCILKFKFSAFQFSFKIGTNFPDNPFFELKELRYFNPMSWIKMDYMAYSFLHFFWLKENRNIVVSILRPGLKWIVVYFPWNFFLLKEIEIHNQFYVID